jgi:hypothetical protein
MRLQLKPKMLALAAALAALTGTGMAAAQDFTFGWNPRSGDVWVDSYLSDVNRYGARYREPFVNEMVRYYGAPRELVTELLVRRNWAPGDVYYACAIAQILGRPCRYVVDEWDRDHGQGWGNVAKRLGIKPGSAEFHRLKRGFVPTYDRWARPITIDEDLYRDFPERAKAIKARGGRAGAPGLEPRGSNGHRAAKAEPARAKAHGNDNKAGDSGKAGAGGKNKAEGKGKGNDNDKRGKGNGKG